MGRHIQDFDGDWVEYVPDVGDNRDDPDPMTVEVRPLTTPEFKAIQRLAMTPLLRGKKDSVLKATQALQDRVLTECVRAVTNYSLPKVGAITTGEQFAKHAEPFIQDEVFAAIQDMSKLSEGLKKKSSSRSVSSSPTIPPGNGPAADALAIPAETPNVSFATATPTPTRG